MPVWTLNPISLVLLFFIFITANDFFFSSSFTVYFTVCNPATNTVNGIYLLSLYQMKHRWVFRSLLFECMCYLYCWTACWNWFSLFPADEGFCYLPIALNNFIDLLWAQAIIYPKACFKGLFYFYFVITLSVYYGA